MKRYDGSEQCPCGSGKLYSCCCLLLAGSKAQYIETVTEPESVTVIKSVRVAYERYQSGYLPQAELICREVLQIEPDNPDALYLLGMIAHRIEKNDIAAHFMFMALQAAPEIPDYYHAFANILVALNRPDKAIACCQSLSMLLINQNKFHEAVACCRRISGMIPAGSDGQFGDAVRAAVEAYNNVGCLLAAQDKPVEAASCYQWLIELDPDNDVAHYNLGGALVQQGRLAEAVTSYRKALAINPEYSEAYNNLGVTFESQLNFDESASCYRQALAIKPDYVEALNNLGHILMEYGWLPEAFDCYQNSLAINPENLMTRYGLLATRHYLYSDDNEDAFSEVTNIARRLEYPVETERLVHKNLRDPEKKLRIGFVSGDLCNHPVGRILEMVLRHVNRNAFVYYVYANQSVSDDLSERIMPYFEEWVAIKGMSDEQLVARICADGIDILIDLSGHTSKNRLSAFAYKPAPVQVTWLGYANTTGLQTMDFILADPITVPQEDEKFYSEKIWRMPETYLCFPPPDVNIDIDELPALTNGYITFGSFNNPSKINDSVIACWAEILKAVPDSILFMKYRHAFEIVSVREKFSALFGVFDIGPERLRFGGMTSKRGYFESLQGIDIGLDPFPYAGVTTTCEALWMGVPVLTLRMRRGMIGHNGELIMSSVGLTDWIAGSIEEYVGKSVEFSRNLEYVAHLRSGLRKRLLASPLCEASRFTRNLECALRGMWQAQCCG